MGGETISADAVAQDQIRAFVERILRLKEEAKAINDDIREIYAEAKGNGFDKTVLGKLVTYVGKRETSAAAMEEADALFDLYLAAYDGSPSRTHAHAHEGDEHRNGLAGPANGGDARTANTKPAPNSRPRITGQHQGADGELADRWIDPTPANSEPASAADRDAGGGEDAPVSCVDSNSTAARKDVQDHPNPLAALSLDDESIAGTQAPPVDTNSPVTIEGSSSTGGADVDGDGGAQSRPQGIRVSTSLAGAEGDVDRQPNSEPGNGHVGEMPTMATRQGGEESGMLDSLSARAVVPGGVHIPHHGSVNQ